MKKLTLTALIASTLFITACEQAQDATEHAGHAGEAGKEMANDASHPVGTQEDINALHDQYHEKMKTHQ